jgi:hypothetical protein
VFLVSGCVLLLVPLHCAVVIMDACHLGLKCVTSIFRPKSPALDDIAKRCKMTFTPNCLL